MSHGASRNVDAAADRERLHGVAALVVATPSRVSELLDMLSDPSWIVRRSVISGLASLGELAVEPLCHSLQHARTDEARIAATVDALVASSGDADSAVTQLATDPNPAVLADVAHILGRRRSARSVPTLILLTQHSDDNVALAAIEALGRVGGSAAVDALVACLASGQFFRMFPAIDVLGRSGDPRAVAPLAALLHDPRLSHEAARALGHTADRAAVSPLAALLASPSDASVRVAVVALIDLCVLHQQRYGLSLAIDELLRDVSSPSVVRRLLQCLPGADLQERLALCQVLGALGESEALPGLLRMLDAEPQVAAAAAEALQKLVRETDATLLDALSRGSSERRRVLLPLITQASAVDVVRQCLSDSDPVVRASACEALMRMASFDALPQLFALLEDESARVVHAASAAIQALGSNDTEGYLLAAAQSPNTSTRRSALRILAYFGYPSSLELFRAALSDPDFRVREGAIWGLAFLEQEPARELLLEATKHADPRLRAASMRALGQRAVDAEVETHLLDALNDDDAWVRYYACQSLGKLGITAASEPLSKLLVDRAGQVRVAAIEALSHLATPSALTALRSAAQSEDPDVERAALLGLSIAQDVASIPTLLAACAKADAATRLLALSALAAFDSDAVVPMLAHLMRDADESVRTAAVGLLAGRAERQASRALIEALSTQNGDSVQRALSTYSPTRVPALLSALEAADDALAPLLGSCLSRMRHPDATAALFQALHLPNASARKAAATVLAAIGTRQAYAALARVATDDSDPEVRRICTLFLSQ